MCQGVIAEGQPKFVNRPWIPFSANIIAPARACPELRGFISRELAMLESVPGWHILPNGIMVHSNPNAVYFHDPRSVFGDEWTSRMTLIKDRKESQWQQVESLVDYRSSPAPFQLLPQGPRKILTFIATSRIRDYFGPDCEVPVSQYPLLDGESPSWPEDEEVDREGGEIYSIVCSGLRDQSGDVHSSCCKRQCISQPSDRRVVEIHYVSGQCQSNHPAGRW